MSVPLVDINTISNVKLAIIGGSGLYHLSCLEPVAEVFPDTPWGKPSDHILVARLSGTEEKIAFLSRHGRGHTYTPSEVPSQANIAALKKLGVQVIIAFSAVGSLQKQLKPLDFVLPSQIIDRTKGIRPSTFFGNGLVAHCMFGEPFCQELSEFIYQAVMNDAGKSYVFGDKHINNDVTVHKEKTLVCMEGPAFSTIAESELYRSWGADLINMSAVPESKLAREAEIVYQMVCMVTDYDCWNTEEDHVTVDVVLKRMATNGTTAKNLAEWIVPRVLSAIDSGELKSIGKLKGSMKYAVITAKEKRNPEQVQKIDYLLPGYY